MFRTTRAHTLEMVQGLSQCQMDFEPAPGKWSVGEVLDHLILGQRLNLSYIAEVIGMKKAGQRPVLRLSFTDVDVSIGYLPKSMLPALFVSLGAFTLLTVVLLWTRTKIEMARARLRQIEEEAVSVLPEGST